MEVSVDEVSCLVRDWLSSSLRAAPSRPLPLYQPISPRPERLGLGAEVSGNTAPPKALTGSKVWQSVSGKRKSHHPSSMSVPEDCPIQGISLDDDASCSRSAAVDGAKRKQPAASFTTEMAQSRKRRRRRKKDKTLELNTDGIDVDMWKGESVRTMTQLTRPTSDGTSTFATELDKPLQANSASLHDVEGGGTFQLFVHIEGASEREKESTCPSEEHETKWSQREKMKTNTKQALRGGSAHYCNKRRGKRLLKGSLSDSKHHPSSSAELSNCHTSITSMGAAQSNSVSKQGALFEESQDRLKGKELRQSHTPPGPAVDAGHHSSEVTQHEASRTPRKGSRTLREGSNIIMEKGGHRRRVTRGSNGHMRCRKGTRIAQSSSHSLISRLYLRKI